MSDKTTIELIDPVRPLTAGETGNYIFRITLGAPVASLGGLLIFPPITEIPWIWSMVRWGLGNVIVHGPADARLDAWIVRADRFDHTESNAEMIRIANLGRPLKAGEQINLDLHDTRVQTYAMRNAWFSIEEDREGKGPMAYSAPIDLPALVDNWPMFRKKADFKTHRALTLDILPAAPARIVAVLDSKPDASGAVTLRVRFEDAFGNATPVNHGSLQIESTDKKLGFPGKVELENKNSAVFSVSGKMRDKGTASVIVRAPEFRFETESSFTSTEIPMPVYFGDLHGHSELSDGLGKGEDFFRHARDISFCDFVSLTDHNRFDQTIIDLTEEFHEPGRFVTIFGRERGDSGIGHRNYYALNAEDVTACGSGNAFKVCEGRDVLMVPHHTNTASRHWECAGFEPTDHEHERLIEVVQVRGSFETPETGGPVYGEDHGASVQAALAMGRRYGFVGGSDTHRGNPAGPSHPAGPFFHRWKPFTGITCACAENLSRESLWESLWNRRTYVTTGTRILLDFTINGAPMGSETKREQELRIQGFAAGTDTMEVVELVRDNKVCHSIAGDGSRIARMDYTDKTPGKFYYLRVRQRDGHHAYSSPIWIN